MRRVKTFLKHYTPNFLMPIITFPYRLTGCMNYKNTYSDWRFLPWLKFNVHAKKKPNLHNTLIL